MLNHYYESQLVLHLVHLILACFRFDWLEIHDGDSIDAPVIGDLRYCGPNIPGVFTSTRNTLFIRFKTDSDVGKKGFEINVECGK